MVGTLASIAFFSSPAKGFLIRQLKLRNKPHAVQSAAQEPDHPPTLGLPNDPEKEFDEAVQEIKAEIEARKKSGNVVAMPTGEELKTAVEGKIGRKL